MTDTWRNLFCKVFWLQFFLFFKTYIKAFFFTFFPIFYGFLKKKYPIFLKSMTKIAPFPQPNFAIWLRFLTIFQEDWPHESSWKIAKSVIFCSSWPVEAVLSKFSENLRFRQQWFSLNISVVMHPNGPECLINE